MEISMCMGMGMGMGMDGNYGWNLVVEEEWRKGPWTAQEDRLLIQHVKLHGEGRWTSVAKLAGLKRNGKSCRLRWVNYLRPDLKRGKITPTEERIIVEMHAIWGNRWSVIARSLPGRTDNEIKNYWRTHFKKKGKSPIGNSKESDSRLVRLQHFHHNLHQCQKQQQLVPLSQAQGVVDMESIMSMLDENGNNATPPLPQIKLDSAGFICYANSADEIGGLFYSMINNYATEPETIPEDTTPTDNNSTIIWDDSWNLIDDVNNENINYFISMNRGFSLLNSTTPTY